MSGLTSCGVLEPAEMDGLVREDATVETRTVSGSESDWVVVRREAGRRRRGVAVVEGGTAVEVAAGVTAGVGALLRVLVEGAMDCSDIYRVIDGMNMGRAYF